MKKLLVLLTLVLMVITGATVVVLFSGGDDEVAVRDEGRAGSAFATRGSVDKPGPAWTPNRGERAEQLNRVIHGQQQ